MRKGALLCQLKKRFRPTTDSAHSLSMYPNHIKDAALRQCVRSRLERESLELRAIGLLANLSINLPTNSRPTFVSMRAGPSSIKHLPVVHGKGEPVAGRERKATGLS